jgi:hypothetical protein
MTAQSEAPVKKRARFLGMSTFLDQCSIPLLAVGCSQNRLFWHWFASSVRQWGFSLLGELGNKIDKMPRNHVLQRMRPLRYGDNQRS